MRLGYHTITWGGLVGDPAGVTSVKDSFYRVNAPMDLAVREIADLGYEGVEMFDGNVADYSERPTELQDMLKKSGVQLIGVYTGANFIYKDSLDDELYRVRRAAGLARQFGAAALVVGGGARRAAGTTDADYTALAAALDRVCDIAEEHGLAACYHPHLNTIVESPAELDRLMSHTRIGFCPDTAHLQAGGGDPAALIRRYPDRIRHVHLKDLDKATTTFLPLGQGDVDFPDVLAALGEVGYDGWLVVELDSYDGPPREAAATSKKYLESVLATAGGITTSGEDR